MLREEEKGFFFKVLYFYMQIKFQKKVIFLCVFYRKKIVFDELDRGVVGIQLIDLGEQDMEVIME